MLYEVITDRKGDYQYEGKFYAPADNTPVYFVPAKSMDGSYNFV